MSYGRMVKAEADLSAEVAGWLAAAEAADAQDDAEHGPARRGDEMPDWIRDKDKRLGKIRQAKAELEAEARAEAEEKAARPKTYRGGRRPKTPPGQPTHKIMHRRRKQQVLINLPGAEGLVHEPLESDSPSARHPRMPDYSDRLLAVRRSSWRRRTHSATRQRPGWW
jgi:hypothetical protein